MTRITDKKLLLAMLLLVALGGLSACGEDDGDDLEALRSALGEASVSLADAACTGLAERDGATFVGAELEVEDDEALFEVQVLDGATVYEIEIDTQSGEVLGSEEDDDEDETPVASLDCDTIRARIDAAEAEVGGDAVEFEVEEEIEAEVLTDSSLWEVVFNEAGEIVETVEDDEDEADD